MTRACRVLYVAVKAARLLEAFKGELSTRGAWRGLCVAVNRAEVPGWELEGQKGKLNRLFKALALVIEHIAL